MRFSILLKSFQILAQGLAELPILVYHSIGHKLGTGVSSLSLEKFHRQMSFFKKNKLEVVSLERIIEIIKCGKKPDKPIISITFDDGYADSFSQVFPILKDLGLPAGVFVTIGNIGRQGYVNYKQLEEMFASGLVTIGSHTVTHPYLPELDHKTLHYEIGESKKILENNLGININFFAYPWGGFTPEIQEIVRNHGYQAAFTTNMKIDNKRFGGDALYAIKRLTMAENESYVRFLIKVSGFGTCFARRVQGQ